MHNNSIKRDTLFISHATPEDNNFSLWLASRLRLLGYKVWLDKDNLLGGESFWGEIDQVIRNQAIKFLLVYSNNICHLDQPGVLKVGISKEFDLAETIARQDNLKDFILCLHIDNSPHNLFIGSNRLNHISFNQNWAIGLNDLLRKLESEKIQLIESDGSSKFFDSFKQSDKDNFKVIEKKEGYFSNYLPIINLPKSIAVNEGSLVNNESVMKEKLRNYIYSQIGSTYTHFFDKENPIDFSSSEHTLIAPIQAKQPKLVDIVDFEGSLVWPHDTIKNNVLNLLKETFHSLMSDRGLLWHEDAAQMKIYYYPISNPAAFKIRYKLNFNNPLEKEKRKSLVGDYLDLGNWHFGISAKPTLWPIVGYNIKSHIVFTTDGVQIWEDLGKMHTHRRKKGRRFFNVEWRDMLIAMLCSLKNGNGNIETFVTPSLLVKFSNIVARFTAEFGYIDPTDSERQDILAYQEYEELLIDEA